jgi:ABC-type antimicrobial peptide transport system permease subunit
MDSATQKPHPGNSRRIRRPAPEIPGLQPMVAILARYASRFSVRALNLSVDSSILWVGAGLAVIAAVLLAAVVASFLPAARAARVDVIQARRAE